MGHDTKGLVIAMTSWLTAIMVVGAVLYLIFGAALPFAVYYGWLAFSIFGGYLWGYFFHAWWSGREFK